jgi:hypothetical protein
MAKKARVWDGSNWQELATAQTDLTNYPNMTTTPISGFRNEIINGGFDIWQRGTSFTPSSNLIYTADRFFGFNSGNGSMTVSRQTFTPGNVISGYEPQYYLRSVIASVGTSTLFNLGQRIEDVRKFSGQTVTVSFWMKSDASRTVTGFAYQVFGTGGSSATTTQYGTFNVTTSWQRFTATVTIPSISGKTIGADNYLAIELNLPAAIQTTEIWGMQVEKGSIATPFEQRPIGTELALCQRYYWRINAGTAYARYGIGHAYSTVNAVPLVVFPVTMRIVPTSFDGSALSLWAGVSVISATIDGIDAASTNAATIRMTSSGLTAGVVYQLLSNNSTSGFLAANAEL